MHKITDYDLDNVRPLSSETIATIVLRQFAKLWPLMLLIYIPILLGLSALVLVNLKADIPLRIFFIDTVAEFNAPMYIGLLSNFGVLLWCGAASVCLFGGWLTFGCPDKRELTWFLICSGLISALLMFDDLYLLHEEVLPDHMYIPQKWVFVGYGGLVLAFLIRFRQMIVGTDFLLLLIAFGFFSLSVFVDLFVTSEEIFIFGSLPGRHLIEDGFKLFGIVNWSVYFVRTCIQKVSPLTRTA